MYKLILSIICIAVFSLNANSQSQDTVKTIKKHNVGFHASSLSGLGLSYRYWPKKAGIQVTVLPVFLKGKGHFLSSAITGLYTLNEGKTVDLYSYLGVHYISIKSSGNQTSSNSLNTGVGFGFKINFTESFNLNIQAGYGLYNITDTFVSTIAGGTGLYFTF